MGGAKISDKVAPYTLRHVPQTTSWICLSAYFLSAIFANSGAGS
jgi:hypothetical protein